MRRFCLALLPIWILVAGCGEETKPPCADCRSGAVEGRVFSGGVGQAAFVHARPHYGTGSYSGFFQVQADSTGWYRLAVPEGIYDLAVSSESMSQYEGDAKDTVRVGTSVRRHDFLRGRAEVRLVMPEGLEGRRFVACLRSGREQYLSGNPALVRNGRVDFVFPLVSPATYRIGVGSYQSEIYTWLPAGTHPEEGDSLPVALDHPALYEHEVQGWGELSGTVLGSWQEAHAWAPQVTAYAADSSVAGFSVVQADGTFTLDVLSARPVKLDVHLTDIDQWMGGDSFETATVFDLHPGDHIADVSIVESGVLCRLEGPGYRVEHNATVTLRSESGRLWTVNSWGQNPIPICNLPSGRYTVKVTGSCQGQDWADQWYDGTESEGEATPVELSPGHLASITFNLVEGGRIQGQVLAADSPGVREWYVQLYNSDRTPLCYDDYLDASGVFSRTGLANGDYYLAACHYREATWWYPGTADPDSAAVIKVRDHVTITGIEWHLPSRVSQ